ncbi:T9SS-dependent choice-of-anchor J family protein [Sanyastnella coralliicola]|uniref:T9SS-dependent choice-of-anchor J family protein n=1 Tax=Sanyastnella coralliicola TaxID=3069118 RepID=UPI0027B9FCFF|nr:T9SS type A sorting domain-containing protein [Longitalea sp. SCSIO 12813]
MKLVYTLFGVLLSVGASAQIIFEEYFDNGMPAEVVLVNLDELTPDDPDLATMADSAWTVRNISAQGFGGGSGSDAAFSVSWYEGDEGPSDDWMILPGVQLGSDPYLSWTGMAITSSGDFRDQYQVFVVADGQAIENFFLAAPIFDTGNEGEEIEETFHQMSLADFANETVYIAFRNFTQPYNPDLPTGPGNGGNELAIDNIVVSEGAVAVQEIPDVEIRCWPLPADNELRVQFDQAANDLTWSIVDLKGKVVLQSSEGDLAPGAQISINVSALATGNYILNVTANGSSSTTQVSIR